MTVTLPPARQVAMHESHHAAALCLAGMVPIEVRIDWPTENDVGVTTVDWGDDGVDPDKARHVLVAVLLGGMCNGFQGWDRWPIDPERAPRGAARVAEQARCLAEYLKLDHAGWLHVLWQANQLAKQPRFRRLAVLIANQLERVEVLDADDLQRIHEEEACST